MKRQPKFSLIFAPETIEHLDFIEQKYHRLMQKAIDEQLTFTPTLETRNRKSLEEPAPFDATWELRCGPGNRFRIFYDVAADEVEILAIGVKKGNRLFIGGEEYIG